METIKYCLCLITADSQQVVNNIAQGLVSEKLAACVNIIKGVKSIYRWEGKIEESGEFLLIVKTKTILIKDIIKFVKDKHTYTVPEIIFLPIIDGNEEYLNWVGANTLFTTNISKDRQNKK